MSHEASDVIDRVVISWIEGRLENVLERQKQLAALHQSVRKRSDNLVQGSYEDLNTPTELATAELITALDAINAIYERLSFNDVLATERNLKNGGDAATFFVPLGVTLIVQLSSSPIVSTLGPLAAALAGGNPTIVLGSRTVSTTNVLLGEIILEALDHEAFHFENSVDALRFENFTQQPYATVVLHSHEASHTIGPLVRNANPSVRVLEPYYGIPAGIIDRSAGGSLDTAKAQIVLTLPDGSKGNPLRFPRLFFVDESVIASVKERLHGQQEKANYKLDEWLRKYYSGSINRYSTGTGGEKQIADLPKVEATETVRSTDGSEIALVPTRSLDHTIDLLNKINAGTGSQVIYVFAGGKEAFYLGNFITTSHVYINEIPYHSLVLTVSRSASDTTTHPYSLEAFSELKTMRQVSPISSRSDARRPAKLKSKEVNQFQGGRMSYFEQGLILGAAMGLVALTGLGFLSYRGFRAYLLR
ncbi:ALDH-like protein [Lophiostoma macrostomum CBS 122681]|uniref:ALDH-like protein n=1 Tax=Lophiostoma macrostomum CBS 122681 TaxID=1314788 RepID=A0A6A6SJI3_9PLEO|nr:ALDH-like protein [Lophiostoma macrostomum CBS 122681]